jgi:hypothetical protein
MSNRLTMGDFVAAHPFIDLLVPLIITGVGFFFGGKVPGINKSWQNLFVSLSTISGLVMTAATFICTMTYQSDSRHMKTVRERYPDELSKNWISIIAWTLTTAVLPLVSICAWNANHQTAFGIALFSLIMMIAKTARSLHWLKYTLFMHQVSSTIGESFTDADMAKATARRKS